MNINELNALIAAIPKDDVNLISFYENMRKDLMKKISTEVQSIIDKAA